MSRRALLGGGAAAIGGGIVAGVLGASTDRHGPAREPDPPAPPPLRLLNQAEAATLAAMADRVFPPDGESPGAGEIGVVTYLDRQLAGEWGGGARLYRQGPFAEAVDSGLGYQLPLTPRALYKHVLARIDEHSRRHYSDRGLAALSAAEQDEVLTALEGGDVELGLADGRHGFTSAEFFTLFLSNVKEGLFADPIYGGNRDVQGWKWIGFPGDPMAYGDSYFGFFSSWHVPYDVEPKGLASRAGSSHTAGHG